MIRKQLSLFEGSPEMSTASGAPGRTSARSARVSGHNPTNDLRNEEEEEDDFTDSTDQDEDDEEEEEEEESEESDYSMDDPAEDAYNRDVYMGRREPLEYDLYYFPRPIPQRVLRYSSRADWETRWPSDCTQRGIELVEFTDDFGVAE